MLFRRLCFAGLALAALGLVPATAMPALAQTQPIAAAAPVSEAHLAAAREVLVGSGAVRSFDVLVPNIIDQLRQTFTRQRPELTKDLEASLATVSAEISTQRDELLATAARIYASRMTETELKETAAFFNSASGKRYVAEQPAIFDGLFVEMQGWMGRVSDVAVTRLREEMKKKGHDL